MDSKSNELSGFWDNVYTTQGHTGYRDTMLSRYDQPIRLAVVNRLISRLFSKDNLINLKALDIGCGVGDFISLMRKQDISVTGLDISAKVIEHVQKRFAEDKGVRLLHSSVIDAKLPAASFDLITSITVLQHILTESELVQVLKELRGLLKANGRIIILELAPTQKEMASRDLDSATYLLERPPSVWRSAFEKAGFRIESEPVMPQLGITMLQGLRVGMDSIRQLLSSKDNTEVAVDTCMDARRQAATPQKVSKFKQLKREGLKLLRRSCLIFAWPFDRLLRFPLFVRGNYKVFVLKAE